MKQIPGGNVRGPANDNKPLAGGRILTRQAARFSPEFGCLSACHVYSPAD